MLAIYTGETTRALVRFTAHQSPREVLGEVLVPADTKAGDVTRAVYPKGHQWFEVCPGPSCKVIRLIDEIEIEMEARVSGDLLDAPMKINGYPVIRWYEIRTAQGQRGVAMVWRPNSTFGNKKAWVTWFCSPAVRLPDNDLDLDSQHIEWDSGHYDLTIDEAENDFFERCRRIGR